MEIKIWAQIFFDDGSVSEGKRIPADLLDCPEELLEVGLKLLSSSSREEGYLLVWGAGELFFAKISSSSLEVSRILAWENWKPWSLRQKNLQ